MNSENNNKGIFQAAFENANIGIIQVGLDGQILCANSECVNIWGYPLDSLTKMNINYIVVPESDSKDAIDLLLGGNDKTIFEKLCLHKDGHIITCEVSSFMLQDTKNNPLYFIFNIRDITQHKHQNENLISRLHYEKNLVRFSNTLMLKQSNAITKGLHYLLLASKSSRVYIFENFIDDENKLSMKQTYESCAEGVEPEIDNPQLQHVLYQEHGFGRWQAELSKNKIINGIVSDFPIDEREILEPQEIKSILAIPLWVAHKWFGFIGFDDTVSEKVWQKEDIDLLRTASEIIGLDIENERNKNLLIKNNEQLKQAIATKDRFISILGHDLKSPFRSVLGFSELLLKNINDYDIDKIKEFAGFINSSSKQTYNLLENLLEWSRSQQNRIAFNPKISNLLSIIQETYLLTNNTAEAKSIKMKVNIPTFINIKVDREMIKTVVRNILNNAIKFTENKGSISISARKDANKIEIKISDTGIGMSESTINSLFKIGEIVSIPGTVGERGTGFGLLLCKEFIDKHKGTIDVESEIGKGSSFKIVLPV